MKDFLLVFRTDYKMMENRTPEQAQAMLQEWMDWFNTMGDALVTRGNRLVNSGHVIKADGVVTNGPYSDIKEFIGGFSMIRAKDYNSAVAIAKQCPILKHGGSVEVREVDNM